MAVSAPFNTAVWVNRNDVSPHDVTMTIAGGHSNTVLIVWVAWAAAGVTITSVTWDFGGTAEALTSVGAAVNFAAGVNNVQAFRRLNPTAGAGKTVRVVYSGAADITVTCAAYDGVDQTTPTANLTSNTTGAALAVTAVSGDATTTVMSTSNTVTATDQTLIDLDPGGAQALGADYALATGTMTHTWTGDGGTQAVIGFAIKQVTVVSTTLEWKSPAVQLTNHQVTSIVNMQSRVTLALPTLGTPAFVPAPVLTDHQRQPAALVQERYLRATSPMPVPYLRTTPTRVTNPLDWVLVTPDVIWTDG